MTSNTDAESVAGKLEADFNPEVFAAVLEKRAQWLAGRAKQTTVQVTDEYHLSHMAEQFAKAAVALRTQQERIKGLEEPSDEMAAIVCRYVLGDENVNDEDLSNARFALRKIATLAPSLPLEEKKT